MKAQAKKKQVAIVRKRVTKRERRMTDTESSDLLESASQALAMVRGAKLVGGRISVRQAPAEPRPRDRKDIVRLRERLNFSQGMLARALNVSPSTVQAWEAGRRTPSDAALKLLAIAEKHPEDLLDSV
jgi:putative transcriptional regulator